MLISETANTKKDDGYQYNTKLINAKRTMEIVVTFLKQFADMKEEMLLHFISITKYNDIQEAIKREKKNTSMIEIVITILKQNN